MCIFSNVFFSCLSRDLDLFLSILCSFITFLRFFKLDLGFLSDSEIALDDFLFLFSLLTDRLDFFNRFKMLAFAEESELPEDNVEEDENDESDELTDRCECGELEFRLRKRLGLSPFSPSSLFFKFCLVLDSKYFSSLFFKNY